MTEHAATLVAFLGTDLLVRGPAPEVVLACKRRTDEPCGRRLAIYAASSGHVLDVDLSGDEEVVLERLASHPVLTRAAPGEDAGSRYRRPRTPERLAADAAYRFMHDLVGDIVGFEEASRALFALDDSGFEREIAHWPRDVRDQLARFRVVRFRDEASRSPPAGW